LLYCVRSARASNNINNNDGFHEITVVKSMWQLYDIVIRMCFYRYYYVALRLSVTLRLDVSAVKRTTRFYDRDFRISIAPVCSIRNIITIFYGLCSNRPLSIYDRRKITHRKRPHLCNQHEWTRSITIFTIFFHISTYRYWRLQRREKKGNAVYLSLQTADP